MFYVNNEQVKGVFLNGRDCNYLAYGFGKIIPEDRNAEQLNLNLAYKYLNKYGVEYGTVKDGYENALVSPRIDKPDSNGIFHTPFTYYYNGNIILTKNIPVLITNGEYALRNALVYSDMNINGSINYFASNTDFQGHNVNVFPENEDYEALLCYEMLNNCSNCNINTYNVIPGFSYMSYCNFNVELPKDSKPEMTSGFAFLNTAENCNYNIYNGNVSFNVVKNCKFRLENAKNVDINGAYSTNFNLYNAIGTATLRNLNNVKFIESGAKYDITTLDNCLNSLISANTVSGTIENVYNTRIELKDHNPYFGMWRVDKCEITGFPTSAAYTTNCTFNASIPVAVSRNSYATWNNVWPHTTPRGSFYYTNAGLRSVDNFSLCYLNSQNGSLVYGSGTFSNVNNMQCDIKAYYSGIVTAYLPTYNMNIKLNVDCNTLNLGIFQAGPPHGFRNATISADNIYAKGNMPSAYVQVGCDTKIYCENYCNVAFRTSIDNINSVLQPVILINNYQYSNDYAFGFGGGLTRIGRLNYQGGRPADLTLAAGACVFINNATLGNITVNQNSLLFLGDNVTRTKSINVESGSLVVNLFNWDRSGALGLISSKSFAWNIWDKGPWDSMRLIDYCLIV